MHKLLLNIALMLIRFYQIIVSPMLQGFFGPNCGCRFHPTCSEYGRLAFMRYGLIKGFLLIGYRILRCHPWHLGSEEDPVPSNFKLNSLLIWVKKIFS